MPLSLSKIIDWLTVFSGLLVLICGLSLAIWQGGKPFTDNVARLGRHPYFDYNFPPLPKRQVAKKITAVKGLRSIEPFWQNEPVKPETEDLNLRELVLGLVVVTSTNRYCLSNGTMMFEGQESGRFTVSNITEDGVWYTAKSGRFFLRVGERVFIDHDGKVHAENSP